MDNNNNDDKKKTKTIGEEEKGPEIQPFIHKKERDESDSVEALLFRLEEVQRKCIQISETFEDFYGENDAKIWFEQVKSNYSRYLEDDRRIFKELAHLHSEKKHLEQLIHMAKKKEEYAELSLPELINIILHLENKIEQFEQRMRGGKGFSCKYIISIGGRKGEDKAMPYCFAFDLETHEHQRLPDLPTARYQSAAIAIGSHIYVAGGLTSSSVWTTAFEIFDFITNKWTSYDGIPAVLEGIQGSVHGNNILVWGRTDGNILLVFMFDTSKLLWEVVPSPPNDGCNLHVTYAKNKLLCQIIFKQNQEVYDMKLYVLEMTSPNLSWIEADHKFSSLKALLLKASHFSSYCNLTFSKSHENKLYIDIMLTEKKANSVRVPEFVNVILYREKIFDGYHNFFSYCMQTNTYCSKDSHGGCIILENGLFRGGKLLACHDDIMIYEHKGGIKLIIPSNEAATEIYFDDPPQCVHDRSVAIVSLIETSPTAVENAPC